MAAGTKLGIRLIRPSRTLLKTNSRSRETIAIATMVPRNMPSMFRWIELAPTTATPVAPDSMPGALVRSQARARSSSAIFSLVDRLLSVTVIRVAERPTSMRLFRSRPSGKENS